MDTEIQNKSKVNFEIPAWLFVNMSPRKQNVTKVQISKRSHFLDPIAFDSQEPRGRSRRWGDSEQATQELAIHSLIDAARRENLSDVQTALLLATARFESGFNPDAASTLGSASGLGQFIDRTGKAYGIEEAERFSMSANVSAMLAYLKDCWNHAQKKFSPNSEIETANLSYALYHDGPSLKYGGLTLAKAKLQPWIERIQTWLKGGNDHFIKITNERG